jgi:hypothetical protein
MRKMAVLAEQTRPVAPLAPAPTLPATSIDWRQAVPVLTGKTLSLRELRVEDAPTLF